MKLFKNLSEASKQREEVQTLKINIQDEKFPEDLSNFPNLCELYLEGSCQECPAYLPGWEKLKVLSIKWPQFKGELSFLFSLPALENLKIINTPILSFKLPLGHAAAPMKSLTIKGCGLLCLPEEISMLNSLTEMNLSVNQLSSLPPSFVHLKLLKRLNLDQNVFSMFPDFIKRISALGHLSMDGNAFPEEEKARIQREFHIWVD
jgi:leucine-rich repeat protein SHOC2